MKGGILRTEGGGERIGCVDEGIESTGEKKTERGSMRLRAPARCVCVCVCVSTACSQHHISDRTIVGTK